MKKTLTFGIIALILGLFAIPVAKAFPLYYLPAQPSAPVNATTSTSYIKGGVSTTTKTFTSDGIEQVAYMVTLSSSTTAPTLCWKNEASHDGTRWYNIATSSAVTPGGVENCWTYASTTGIAPQVVFGTDGKEIGLRTKIVVEDLDTLMTRTSFYIRPGVAARLGVEEVLKNEVVSTK